MTSLCGVLFLLFTSCSFARCQDLIRESHCWNENFRLGCGWGSILAIHEAFFTNDEAQLNRSACAGLGDGRGPCTEDVRTPINRRCSGMAQCHFNLTEDYPERECRCRGVIVLSYSCVPESKLERYCNLRITESSGYISSPGYPRFYPKVSNCSWLMQAAIGRRMRLSVLDLDMRPGIRSRSGRTLCPHALTVLEDSHRVRQLCGKADEGVHAPIITGGGQVEIVFQSNEFLPARGFLIHYTLDGCQKLPPPRLGYAVYSNERSALYMCCRDHVFNDTLSNSRLLRCVDGVHWNGTVPPCLSLAEALSSRKNGSRDPKLLEDTDIVEVYLKKHKYIEEILIPAASIVGLVFGNVAIILLIQKIRKKRKSSTSSQNGRSHGAQTASAPEAPQTLRVPVESALPPVIPPAAPKQAPRVLMTDL